MAKCPICNGCMVVRGSHFVEREHNTNALVRWFCKFCDKYFAREGRGLKLDEVNEA